MSSRDDWEAKMFGTQDDYRNLATGEAKLSSHSQTDAWQPADVPMPSGLLSNMDARAWADHFAAVFPGQAHMVDMMHTWFANAIMCGFDEANRRAEPPRQMVADSAQAGGEYIYEVRYIGDRRQTGEWFRGDQERGKMVYGLPNHILDNSANIIGDHYEARKLMVCRDAAPAPGASPFGTGELTEEDWKRYEASASPAALTDERGAFESWAAVYFAGANDEMGYPVLGNHHDSMRWSDLVQGEYNHPTLRDAFDAFNGGVSALLAAQPPAAAEARIKRYRDMIDALKSRLRDAAKDAERYRWLTDDLAGDEREARNRLLDRMAVMSYSAACAAIDAALTATPPAAELERPTQAPEKL